MFTLVSDRPSDAISLAHLRTPVFVRISAARGRGARWHLGDRERAGHSVDRELLTEQVSNTEFAPTTLGEIEKQLEQVKSDYTQNIKASWTAALASRGFTETEIRDRIALELNQWKLIDARLRPSVQIDQAA